MSMSSLLFLQVTSDLMPVTFYRPYHLRPVVFFFFLQVVLIYFHFLTYEQKLQGLSVILKIFVLFDLEIFKTTFILEKYF